MFIVICFHIHSNRHRVGVWGELANSVNEDYFKVEDDKIVIAILSSTKMATYKSMSHS